MPIPTSQAPQTPLTVDASRLLLAPSPRCGDAFEDVLSGTA
jgi:hypothetical protein